MKTLDAWNNVIRRGDIIVFISSKSLRLGVIRYVHPRPDTRDWILVSYVSPSAKKPRRLGLHLRADRVMKVDENTVLRSYYSREAKDFILELHEVMSVTSSTANP